MYCAAQHLQVEWFMLSQQRSDLLYFKSPGADMKESKLIFEAHGHFLPSARAGCFLFSLFHMTVGCFVGSSYCEHSYLPVLQNILL